MTDCIKPQDQQRLPTPVGDDTDVVPKSGGVSPMHPSAKSASERKSTKPRSRKDKRRQHIEVRGQSPDPLKREVSLSEEVEIEEGATDNPLNEVQTMWKNDLFAGIKSNHEM